jgi:hypothetical protein
VCNRVQEQGYLLCILFMEFFIFVQFQRSRVMVPVFMCIMHFSCHAWLAASVLLICGFSAMFVS